MFKMVAPNRRALVDAVSAVTGRDWLCLDEEVGRGGERPPAVAAVAGRDRPWPP